ncbi:MFS transporter [Oceanivirga salmonicida]|uniref:MFS transporter n=1 Tax=Oceanivirga salmonicida TaxID=1769291 RepID=UPI0008309BE4|nr:MFS transporter [Oceanivirga salmonicida]
MNKLSKRTYMIYGLGVSYFMLDRVFVQWINFFYLPSKESGLNPLLTPYLLTLGYVIIRFIDAIADPVVGYLSDNSKSRFGKRSFFMILGGLPLAISTVLFFYPPTTSLNATFTHFVLVGTVFFISYTLVGGPYNSLVADLSKTKEERINLSTVQSVFRLIFSALPMVLSGLLIAKFSPLGTEYSVEGFQKMVIPFAIVAVIGIYVCALFLKEKELTKQNEKEEKISFRKTIKYLYRKDVILYFLGLFCFFTGFNVIQTSLSYYVSSILDEGTKVTSFLSTLLFIASAIFFPITNILTKKFGFKKIMILNLIMIITGVIGMMTLSNSMWLVNTSVFVIGAGISGAGFIFPPAMLSEIANDIVKESKLSVEGLLFGIQGFFLKLAFMTKAIITIYASIYNAVPDAQGKVNTTKEGTILALTLAIVLFVLSIVFYSLKKEKN